MVYINLLPIREIKRRTNAIRQLTLFAFVLVAVLVALGVVGIYQKTIASQLQKNIAELNKEKQHYNQVLDQIKKLEEDKKEIENRIAVIRELKKSSALTVRVLDEIANLTPTKRIWLTSLNQSGTSLQLNGMALDNQTIAGYMEELKTSKYISDVNLVTSSQSAYAGRNLKSFTLSCVISIPDTAEPGMAPESTQQ
jgi:type IV pilus assembly protein PilN